jgi:hypothetical protein
MSAGRPAKYNTKFHPKDCIRLGKMGLYKKHMAREWKISYDTISRWCKNHPEFFAAYKLAVYYRLSLVVNELEQEVQGIH